MEFRRSGCAKSAVGVGDEHQTVTKRDQSFEAVALAESRKRAEPRDSLILMPCIRRTMVLTRRACSSGQSLVMACQGRATRTVYKRDDGPRLDRLGLCIRQQLAARRLPKPGLFTTESHRGSHQIIKFDVTLKVYRAFQEGSPIRCRPPPAGSTTGQGVLRQG